MITGFSDAGYLILAHPDPRSSCFEQTVFQRRINDAFRQGMPPRRPANVLSKLFGRLVGT
jgi:hypothetical protein